VSFDLASAGDRARLGDLIRASVARLGDRRVFIKADFDLPFRHVDGLLQLCREAGADEASVVTREDRQGGEGVQGGRGAGHAGGMPPLPGKAGA
jgi:hypothetical protein